jgi:hypothetical protein
MSHYPQAGSSVLKFDKSQFLYLVKAIPAPAKGPNPGLPTSGPLGTSANTSHTASVIGSSCSPQTVGDRRGPCAEGWMNMGARWWAGSDAVPLLPQGGIAAQLQAQRLHPRRTAGPARLSNARKEEPRTNTKKSDPNTGRSFFFCGCGWIIAAQPMLGHRFMERIALALPVVDG